jgi:hypothetical protein
MLTVRRPGPRVVGLRFRELITRRPSALGSTAQILNTETVSQVLLYTVDRDVDSQERTGTKKKTDRRRWASDTTATMATSRALVGARWGGAPVGYPRRVWLLRPRAIWRARFAYLEVAVVGEGSRRRRPSLLKLGRRCGAVSDVPQATGKTPMGAADSDDPS